MFNKIKSVLLFTILPINQALKGTFFTCKRKCCWQQKPPIIYCLVTVLFATIINTVSAQRDTTINREVEVVKSFKPTITGCIQINDMPKIEETEIQKPSFNYNIKSEPIIATLFPLTR
jgi:hypothetical protein